MTLQLAHPNASPSEAREFAASCREIEVRLLREWTALGQKLARLRAVEQAYALLAQPVTVVTPQLVRERDRKQEAEKLLASLSLKEIRAMLKESKARKA